MTTSTSPLENTPVATLPTAQPTTRPRRRLRWTSAHIAALVGAFLIAGLTLTAIFAPVLAPYDPTERIARPFQAPSAEHPLGTNDIGQDLLS